MKIARAFILLNLVGITVIAVGCKQGSQNLAKPPPDHSGGSVNEQAFLDTLELKTFHYFWDLADPRTGLIPDRAPTKSFSSIAATGFGLAAYVVGVERGYVSRQDAAARVLKTLKFFWNAPMGPAATGVTGYHGFYYHFLDMHTGLRFKKVELSTIDTALLLGGVLVCRDYFDGSPADEKQIRALADSLYNRVDWPWITTAGGLVSMAWHPESGFGKSTWRGYNEAMILYILALGSPTHPLSGNSWKKWTSTYTWATFYGYPGVQFGPLFGHQYSQMFIDFRGIQDAYMREKGSDYFKNATNATLAQRAYAKENPEGFEGYGEDIWGLTACDGPGDTVIAINGRTVHFRGYSARGVASNYHVDDGTIAPTAAGGSIAFTPKESIAALLHMKKEYPGIWGTYGFLDSFNPTWPLKKNGQKAWYDDDYLGIDQGPILIMAEDYRTGLIWNLLKNDPAIIKGLKKAGFKGGWLITK